MSLPNIFATKPPGNTPASELDANYNAVGALGVIPCAAIGINQIILTPFQNATTINAYANTQLFGFFATGNAIGAVAEVNSLGFLPVYAADGLTAGTLLTGYYYVILYNPNVNQGNGGFQMIANGGVGAGTSLTFIGDVNGSGSSTILLTIGSIGHDLDLAGHQINNLADPIANNDAVNLEFLAAYVTAHAVVNQGGAPSVQEGLLAARPVAGNVGAVYIATDEKVIYRDNGLSWDSLTSAGGGSVTSVALTSADLVVTGSPITNAGTINADLNLTGVAAGTYSSLTVNTKGRVTAAANIPFAGEFYAELPSNKTYPFLNYVPSAMTLLSMFAQVSAGTITVTVNINGTPVVGLNSIAVTSTGVFETATSANVAGLGDVITLTTTGSTDAADLAVTLNVQ